MIELLEQAKAIIEAGLLEHGGDNQSAILKRKKIKADCEKWLKDYAEFLKEQK
jgi:hypothetical protein